jgi:uncharacterized protein
MSSAFTLAALLLMAAPTSRSDPAAFRADWQRWHADRIARLRAPTGWVALAGLHWLEPGENRIEGLPGVFRVGNGAVTLEGTGREEWRLEGGAVPAGPLATDADGATPDRLTLGAKTAAVIARGGKLALRVWDSERPDREAFLDVEAYPPDPRWRIEARWEAYPAPKPREVPSIVGIPTRELAPGRALFTLGGTAYALEPTLEGEALFFVFKDATAPRETYEAGRFLMADPPHGGKVILDFNRAYNPPCAFTPYATCPLPRPENVLPVRIEAGEKKPAGH